jgi:hypothetical protein
MLLTVQVLRNSRLKSKGTVLLRLALQEGAFSRL